MSVAAATNNQITLNSSFGPEVALPGAREVFTNRVHIGGATNRAGYYRVRLVR
jgi:hypothetical protein